MRITHVIPYMHPHAGGPPVFVDRISQKLVKHGWDVRVITTDCMANEQSDDWQKTYRDHYPFEVHKAKFGSYAYSPTLAASLKAAIGQSDLVHLHTLWSYPNRTAARICRELDVPFVIMPQGMIDPNSLQRKKIKKKIYGHLFEWPYVRTASAMIYTHEEERRLAEQSVSGLPKGYIVSMGADEAPPFSREILAGQFFQKYPELRGRKLVVFLGRLHSKKGLDLLIPAFAEVLKSDPNIHLVLVGPGEKNYVQGLHDLIVKLGFSERVLFTGHLAAEAKWQGLAAGTVYVLPSYQENFALTVVEAMRGGLPVVLSRRVNIWEDVTKAGAGLACDLAPKSVATTIVQYLKDPTLRAKAVACGQKLLAEKFNWERSFETMENVYKQLLKN